MSCKFIMYDKCKEDDKYNNDEYNESNENQWLIPSMMSSNTEDVLMWAIWRRNTKSTGL